MSLSNLKPEDEALKFSQDIAQQSLPEILVPIIKTESYIIQVTFIHY